MNRIFLSVLLMSLFCFNSYGKQNFLSGYIIKKNQDTVSGYILSQKSLKASEACIFKESLESKQQTYTPGEIYGYRYLDGQFYISKTIPKAGQENENRVFLEILIEGIVSIYYLRDNNGDRYFIDKATHGMIELSNPQRKHHSNYQGKLSFLMNDCKACDEKINDTKLNYASLVDLAKYYHKEVATTDSYIIYNRNIEDVDYNFIIIYGSTLTSYKFGNKLITRNEFGHQLGLSVKMDNVSISNNSIGISIALLLEFENRLTLRAPDNNRNTYLSYEGVDYRLSSGDAFLAVKELPINMKLLDLKIPVLMDYKIDFDPVTLWFGIGITNKFVLNYNKQFKLVEFEEQYNKSYSSFMTGGIGKIGGEWKVLGKHKLYTNFTYEYLTTPAALNEFLRLTEQKVSFQIGYRF